jgi:hypothetical protein
MNSVIKKISDDIKGHKEEIKRLETIRDGILAYERGAKRKGKKQKATAKGK